jgi:hypothetical protein
MHEIQLEFERIYAERYAYDDDMSGARLYALRAVAPQLIAQGMREAAGICGGWGDGGDAASVAILARAQEIDPQ